MGGERFEGALALVKMMTGVGSGEFLVFFLEKNMGIIVFEKANDGRPEMDFFRERG